MGIALVDDDLYISNVLFVLSAVFMLLTSVAFAITIKVFVHAHPAKVDLQLTELKATSDTSHGAVSEAENGNRDENCQNNLLHSECMSSTGYPVLRDRSEGFTWLKFIPIGILGRKKLTLLSSKKLLITFLPAAVVFWKHVPVLFHRRIQGCTTI